MTSFLVNGTWLNFLCQTPKNCEFLVMNSLQTQSLHSVFTLFCVIHGHTCRVTYVHVSAAQWGVSVILTGTSWSSVLQWAPRVCWWWSRRSDDWTWSGCWPARAKPPQEPPSPPLYETHQGGWPGAAAHSLKNTQSLHVIYDITHLLMVLIQLAKKLKISPQLKYIDNKNPFKWFIKQN